MLDDEDEMEETEAEWAMGGFCAPSFFFRRLSRLLFLEDSLSDGFLRVFVLPSLFPGTGGMGFFLCSAKGSLCGVVEG